MSRYESLATANFVATTDYTYDAANRLSSLTHKRNTTTFAGYGYSYDGLSRLTSVNSSVEGVSNFTYDATSQLTVADHTSQTDENYGYDLNGNRNTSGFTTGQNNQTLAGDGFTYTYDDEGNRTSRTETATGKVQEYTWDYRNRLTQVRNRNTAGGAIVMQVDYTYDALNRMVKRAYDADGAGSGATTNQYWAYDEGINALLEFNGSATTNLKHRYLWSDQVDELLADSVLTNLTTAGNALWALSDHLGTIRDIADYTSGTDSTAITNHRTYNAYGKLVSETNAAVDLLFGFTGKQLDDATGLQHNLFRWYDSNLGQWLSEDPISFAAGDENVRRYVGNGHVDGIDPLGLQEPYQQMFNQAQSENNAMFQSYLADLEMNRNRQSTTLRRNIEDERAEADNYTRNLAQGGANVANGFSNMLLEMALANAPLASINRRLLEYNEQLLKVNLHDWSRGLVIEEYKGSSDWSDMHRWSVFSGEVAASAASMAYTTAVPAIAVERAKGLEAAVAPAVKIPILNQTFTPKPTTLGRVGEVLSGMTGPKTKIIVSGRTRIPDKLTRTTIGESKNVSQLTFTRQLRDYADYAEANKLEFELWVRATTKLSKPLYDAIQQGRITLKFIPGV